MHDYYRGPLGALIVPVSLWLFISSACAISVASAPTHGHPNIDVKVTGTGFAPNEGVDIYFDTTDVQLGRADATGKIASHRLHVPANAGPGTHWFTVLGRHTGNAAQTKFMVRTDWNQFGWNAHGKRDNRNENVLNAGNVSRLQQLWSVSTGGAATDPVIADGTVYVTSADGLMAIDQTTGAVKWVAGLGGNASAPTVLDGLVFAWSFSPPRSETEQAYDTETGTLVWSNDLNEGTVRFSPATANGVLYVPEDIYLQALDPVTGAILWGAPTGGDTGTSTPTVADGIVYVNSLYTRDSNVLAFDAKTGKTIWKTTEQNLTSSPIVVNGVVYTSGGGIGQPKTMYALNAKTGAVIWAENVAAFRNSLAGANGFLYAGGDNGVLYAFRARTGKLVWSTPIGNTPAPAVANGVIYAGASSIYALDASTGSVLWTSPSHPNFSSPVVADGMVVATSTDGNVYAYALDGGRAAVYHRSAAPPPYGSLHPNWHLKVVP